MPELGGKLLPLGEKKIEDKLDIRLTCSRTEVIISRDIVILAGGNLMTFLHKVKEKICSHLAAGLKATLDQNDIDGEPFLEQIKLEEPRSKEHGDFACNIALLLSKPLGQPPRDLATQIVANLPGGDLAKDLLAKVEVAGPGFINIYLKPSWLAGILPEIEWAGENFGRLNIGAGQKIQVEFVSANPTGPLHFGHARGAVVGDTLANVLSFGGYEVEKEFYINNVGRQMDLLGESIYLRLMESRGQEAEFPADGYQGEYIKELARQIKEKYGDSFDIHSEKERIALCREFGYQNLLLGIKEDLQAFGIKFDNWFSERKLHEAGNIEEAISILKKKKLLYEKDGATWFATSRYGDEKDRVVIRSNGEYTYFAADIAYHYDKLQRGFSKIINIWGADHHGHIGRMKAAIEAFGYNPAALDVLIVQMVTLLRGREKMQMSKRSGEFITMMDVLSEVGKDAARFFNLMRNPDSHMDFDLELAKEQSTSNPVYYLQYAHARSAGLFKKAEEEGIVVKQPSEVDLTLLMDESEKELLFLLASFPLTVEESCINLSPHCLAIYGHELAQAFHIFYNRCPIIDARADLRDARLSLVWASQRVLKNLFNIMGISAPETM